MSKCLTHVSAVNILVPVMNRKKKKIKKEGREGRKKTNEGEKRDEKKGWMNLSLIWL